VVDDDDAVREIMVEVLLAEGYRVIPAANGRDALRVAAGISVDLIVSDLMMPEMNGWRLLARLRDLDIHVPVVLITGYMNREGHEVLTNNEIAGFLAKPVELEKLVRMANRVVFPEAPSSRSRVLAVDSDEEARERISTALQEAGFVVQVAADGQEALDGIERFGPDLVLLDVVLPKVDGLEVCRRLRSEPATAEIPIILLTTQSSPQTVQQALALRVDGFIVKPFEPEDLVGRIRRALLHARSDT
jgi:CheY-like chemotaxis protein